MFEEDGYIPLFATPNDLNDSHVRWRTNALHELNQAISSLDRLKDMLREEDLIADMLCDLHSMRCKYYSHLVDWASLEKEVGYGDK